MKQEVEGLTITVRGRTFPVAVEVSSDSMAGSFVVEFDGRALRYDTWEALYKALMEATRKAGVKLNIPITKYQGSDIFDGTVYAVHGATGSPMVEWDGGGKEQLDGGGMVGRRGKVLARLDDEEKSRLRTLIAARDATAEALADFERDHDIDVKRRCEAELGAPS